MHLCPLYKEQRAADDQLTNRHHKADQSSQKIEAVFIYIEFLTNIMNEEYFKYFKQEAAASATRSVAAVVIYGAIAVFATLVSVSLPRVAAVLSVGPNASDE